MKNEELRMQNATAEHSTRRRTTGWGRYILHSAFCIPIAFLALFFLYPLATIVWLGLASTGAGLAALADGYYWRVLWFTTWQAALSTALTLLAALPAAFVFARYTFPGKSLLRALAGVPFVLPTVVVAAAFGALLGPRGALNPLLQALLRLDQPPIQIGNTLALVLIAHVFYNFSVVLRLVGGFWANLDPRLEQAAAVLGAGRWRVLRTVTLPLLLPALGAAALLVFIFCFTSFGVVVILGGPRFATIEVEVYRQMAQLLRLDVAALLSLLQLGCTLLLTLAYTRLAARSAVPLDLRPRGATERRARTTGERALVGAVCALLLVLAGAPLGALALASLGGSEPLAYYRALGTNRTGSIFYVSPLAAIGNSLLLATATTVASLALGTLGAYLLRAQNVERKTQNAKREVQNAKLRMQSAAHTEASERRRDQCSPVQLFYVLRSTFYGLLDALFVLPLGTSAVTLGLGFLVAFARPPLALRSSPLLLVAAHTLVALPFVVRAVLPVLRALDPQLREAAASLGATPLRAFLAVDLPLLTPALLAGVAFAFTVSLGEFGATLLLARPEFPTLPLAIYRLLGQPGALNYGQALALSTLLMLVTAGVFAALERVRYAGGEF